MTRDEAISRFHATSYPNSSKEEGSGQHRFDRQWSERFVDAFVALGMLKFDEPKSAGMRAADVIGDYLHLRSDVLGRGDGANVVHVLDGAGLKIVEK